MFGWRRRSSSTFSRLTHATFFCAMMCFLLRILTAYVMPVSLTVAS